jgi:hypothetical protein
MGRTKRRLNETWKGAFIAKYSSEDRKYCSPNYVENQIELNLSTQVISLVTFASFQYSDHDLGTL